MSIAKVNNAAICVKLPIKLHTHTHARTLNRSQVKKRGGADQWQRCYFIFFFLSPTKNRLATIVFVCS